MHLGRPDIALLKQGSVIAGLEVFVSHAVDPQMRLRSEIKERVGEVDGIEAATQRKHEHLSRKKEKNERR